MVRLTILFAALCAAASGTDLSLGLGAGPASGTALRTEVDAGALVSFGYDFWRFRAAAIGVEVPASFYGSPRTEVFSQFGVSGYYSERLTVALTPGIRARFASRSRVSPWISVGGGGVLIRRTGVDSILSQVIASQRDSNLGVAVAPAAGADLRIGSRWFVRGELRNYLYRTPSTGFVASVPYWGRWNYNPVIAISGGWRSAN